MGVTMTNISLLFFGLLIPDRVSILDRDGTGANLVAQAGLEPAPRVYETHEFGRFSTAQIGL